MDQKQLHKTMVAVERAIRLLGREVEEDYTIYDVLNDREDAHDDLMTLYLRLSQLRAVERA